MTQAQKVFEAIMQVKGQTDFAKTDTGKYVNSNIQTRWNYFQMGWKMCEVAV